MGRTIGQAIDYLIVQNEMYRKDVAKVMNIECGTLTKIIRDEKELSFLMAVRMLQWFGLSLDEFLSMLSDAEVDRKELSTLKWLKKQEIKSINDNK